MFKSDAELGFKHSFDKDEGWYWTHLKTIEYFNALQNYENAIKNEEKILSLLDKIRKNFTTSLAA
jgi:hypothetical protein